ncbi:MAG: hypothetical protein JWP19_828 [Rhodoglobus sp.]|nr:hypothetical protein [Rhodoglobus sp.]
MLTQTTLGLFVALIAVGGVVVGAVVAGAFAVFTGWLENRRQHSRWKREKRSGTHLAFLVLIDRHAGNARMHSGPQTPLEIKEVLEELNEAVSALSLLGPESVLESARALRLATADYIEHNSEPVGWDVARSDYIVACRKSLGIENRG